MGFGFGSGFLCFLIVLLYFFVCWCDRYCLFYSLDVILCGFSYFVSYLILFVCIADYFVLFCMLLFVLIVIRFIVLLVTFWLGVSCCDSIVFVCGVGLVYCIYDVFWSLFICSVCSAECVCLVSTAHFWFVLYSLWLLFSLVIDCCVVYLLTCCGSIVVVWVLLLWCGFRWIGFDCCNFLLLVILVFWYCLIWMLLWL